MITPNSIDADQRVHGGFKNDEAYETFVAFADAMPPAIYDGFLAKLVAVCLESERALLTTEMVQRAHDRLRGSV